MESLTNNAMHEADLLPGIPMQTNHMIAVRPNDRLKNAAQVSAIAVGNDALDPTFAADPIIGKFSDDPPFLSQGTSPVRYAVRSR